MEEAEYNQIISDGKSKAQIIAGKPYNWVSLNYGTVAVHVESIYNDIATVTIDGGEAATPAQRFPELSDGRYHVVISSGKLRKRPARKRSNPLNPRGVAVTDVLEKQPEAEPVVRKRAERYAAQHKQNPKARAAMVAGIEKAAAQVAAESSEVTF